MITYLLTGPLDLQELLVNKVAGSTDIFIFLIFIVIAALAARFKMPGGAVVIVFLMFITLMSGVFIGGGLLQGLLLIIILGITYTIAKSFNRGLSG